MLIKVITISRNIQLSRPPLELCGRDAIMLQVEVPQVPLLRQVAYDVAWDFTFCLSGTSPSAFLPTIEVSSACSRESLHTSCSSVAAGSCHTGGPFLFRNGAAGGGLGGTNG